jgi:hypothetical protein
MIPGNATSPPAREAGEPGNAISFAADAPKIAPNHSATQAHRAAFRRRSRARRTRLAMVRTDLDQALHHASVSAQAGRQRLDSGDLTAAAYVIGVLAAYTKFAAACISDLEDLGGSA